MKLAYSDILACRKSYSSFATKDIWQFESLANVRLDRIKDAQKETAPRWSLPNYTFWPQNTGLLKAKIPSLSSDGDYQRFREKIPSQNPIFIMV